MTKGDLIGAVAAKCGLSKKDVENVLNEAFAEIKKGVKKEGKVAYPDFGTFKIAKRKARMGINPKTKQAIQIKASKTVRFKPAPTFKKSL